MKLRKGNTPNAEAVNPEKERESSLSIMFCNSDYLYFISRQALLNIESINVTYIQNHFSISFNRLSL